jgi:hypothetical protein
MEHVQVVRERSVAMTSARTAGTAVVLTATLGLTAVSWVVAVREMSGMIWAWGPGLVRSRAPGCTAFASSSAPTSCSGRMIS